MRNCVTVGYAKNHSYGAIKVALRVCFLLRRNQGTKRVRLLVQSAPVLSNCVIETPIDFLHYLCPMVVHVCLHLHI